MVGYSDEKDLGQKVSKFSEFITGAKPPSLPINKPYGVAVADKKFFICDTATRALAILDLVQKNMRLFTPPGMGKFGTPVNVAVDADGTRYVADTGRNQVMIYGSDDSYRGVVDDGTSNRPTAVAVSGKKIYVTDLNAHCVHVYDKASRKQLLTIPNDPQADAEKEPGKLFMPVNLAVDAQGRTYVSDMGACLVKVFDADGKFLHTVGSTGDLPGQFARPKGVAVDHESRTYVVDAASQVCQIFDSEGKLLLYFGEPDGSDGQLSLPAAVCVDYDNVGLFQKYAAPGFILEYLVIITNQYGDRKVNVYGFGHQG